MNKLIIILASIACFISAAAAGDRWQKLGTSPSQKTPLPRQLEQTEPPLPAQLIRAGFRLWDGTSPAIAPGNERLSEGTFVQHPTKADRCILSVTDTRIQDRLDREAAEAAAIQAEAAAREAAEAAERNKLRELRNAVESIDPKSFSEEQSAAIAAIKAAILHLLPETR
jgi:hypothetical protein